MCISKKSKISPWRCIRATSPSSRCKRIRDAQNFDALTPDQLRALASRYDLDYLVVDRDVDLPIAYRNEQFRVYSLQQAPAVR